MNNSSLCLLLPRTASVLLVVITIPVEFHKRERKKNNIEFDEWRFWWWLLRQNHGRNGGAKSLSVDKDKVTKSITSTILNYHLYSAFCIGTRQKQQQKLTASVKAKKRKEIDGLITQCSIGSTLNFCCTLIEYGMNLRSNKANCKLSRKPKNC